MPGAKPESSRHYMAWRHQSPASDCCKKVLMLVTFSGASRGEGNTACTSCAGSRWSVITAHTVPSASDSRATYAPPERHRYADPQRAANRALKQRCQVVGVVDFPRDQLAFVGVERADFGRRDAAGRAVQQPGTQALLHRRHGFGCRRLGHSGLAGGLAEAAGDSVHA